MLRFIGTCLGLTVAASVLLGCPQQEPASAPASPGLDLYKARCGNCHQLFPPHSYTDYQWPEVLGRMQSNAGLRDEQVEQVLLYLRSNN